jgi:hypothetical protein
VDGIVTAGTGYQRPVHWPAHDWDRLPIATRVHVVVGRPVPLGLPTHPVGTVHARLEHGRWLAECAGCPSAQYVDPADPRFFCVDCGNAGSNAWFAVVWPDEQERLALERAAVRLPVDDRNWVHPDDLTVMARAYRVWSTVITKGAPA